MTTGAVPGVYGPGQIVSVTSFDVPGVPAPQGSLKAFVVAGRPVLTSDNARTAPWRVRVAWAARAAHVGAPWDGPVEVLLTFRLPRPASAPKRRLLPDRKPDLDKLARACFDALTGIVVVDDARIVSFYARKIYDPEPGLTVRAKRVQS